MILCSLEDVKEAMIPVYYMQGAQVSNLDRVILMFTLLYGGISLVELQHTLGFPKATISKRVCNLRDSKYITYDPDLILASRNPIGKYGKGVISATEKVTIYPQSITKWNDTQLSVIAVLLQNFRYHKSILAEMNDDPDAICYSFLYLVRSVLYTSSDILSRNRFFDTHRITQHNLMERLGYVKIEANKTCRVNMRALLSSSGEKDFVFTRGENNVIQRV